MKLAWIAGLVLLAGCATAYQPIGDTGGYYENQVALSVAGNPDTYTVGFSGNGFTDMARVRAFALRRARDIGRQLGYAYFSVQGETPKSHVTPAYTDHEMPVFKPAIELTIRYYKEKPAGKFLELEPVTNAQ